MAILNDTEFKGISIPQAYIKVMHYDGCKNSLNYTIGYHAKQGGQLVFTEQYTVDYFNLEGDNAIKQAYVHLKSIDKFKSASDC